ncbi:penicillin-binding protein 1C [soil metagenome]
MKLLPLKVLLARCRMAIAAAASGGARMQSRPRWLALVLIALLLCLPRWLPKPALAEAFPSSRSVTASRGELLRMTLASDGQFRLWTPLPEVAPSLQEAVLLYEDQWFYWHPGFNPWAMARASVSTATGERRIGGSTITMQLARRLYRIDSRNIPGKLHQAAAAVWLELRYSKRQILEAYLNVAPYGGNIEGVGAASLTYWRKPVKDLTVPEAINLAVIPQNPRKRLADSQRGIDPDALKRARTRLAALWLARHPDHKRFADEAVLALPFQNRSSLPFLAPHAVDHLLRTAEGRELRSSIDLKTQMLVERVLAEYVKSRSDQGISNASALLIDSSTMQVKAMVGSSDYRDAAIAGQVNGVFARRSPGSTLKPFIYAQALDQGLIHSATILKDAPSNFGAFAPENFDGRFSGPIPAHQALIRSRNIPAVELASRLSKPNLYDFLKMAGVQKLAPEAHYGLALALGGGELTMEELAQLYAMLPNRGELRPLQYLSEVKSSAAKSTATKPLTLLSPEASFVTMDMLRQTPRPDTFAPARPAVAWKTGTSWGFRDAWTAGVFGRYVLVVWVGNFNGASNPAFIGIDAAAPLFLRIVDAVRAEKLDPGEMASAQPANLVRLEVCAASGDLPNAECPITAPAWFITGKSPIRQSNLHRAVLVDTRTGRRACAPGPDTRSEVFEFWPSDMLSLFKTAGMPLRTPPPGECAGDIAGQGAPHIVTPLRGVTHLQRRNRNEPLYLRAEVAGSDGDLRWFADDSLLGSSRPGVALTWNPPRAGRYLLRVVDANGLSDSRELTIESVE